MRYETAPPSAPTPLGTERSMTSSAWSSFASDPSGSSRPRPASSWRNSVAKMPPASACAVAFFTGATRRPSTDRPRTGAYPHPDATTATARKAEAHLMDSGDDKVDQPLGNDHHLLDRLPLQPASHLRVARRRLADLGVVGARRHLHLAAQLPVHLHGDLVRVVDDQARVCVGPVQQSELGSATQPAPQLFGDVGGKRREQLDQHLQALDRKSVW